MTHLTIAYITFRKEPHFDWFIDSLRRQTEDGPDLSLVVVDYYHGIRPLKEPFLSDSRFVFPKPSVWQGPTRLTSKDYFAAANARNTALCYAKDGWIVYVDDLSVLGPRWLSSVREAMTANYIALGAYKKVKELNVEDGVIKSYCEHPSGVDSRWKNGRDDMPVPAYGGLMYGCSVAMPVEALLTINGWDEDADSLGSEDYIAGIMIENHGYRFMYDRRMFTLESEEGHHIQPSLPRFDKGVSPNDKSHAILDLVRAGRHVAPNYFGEGGIRALRDKILNGGQFPVMAIPDRDWYDGEPLSNL